MRTVNNKACVSRPEIIVLPATTEDVAIAVNFARRNGLKVTTLLITSNFLSIIFVVVFSLVSGVVGTVTLVQTLEIGDYTLISEGDISCQNYNCPRHLSKLQIAED